MHANFKTCIKLKNMEFIKKDTGELQASLIVKIEAADYNDRVENALKDLRKKVNLKGFRPGHVPIGTIKKRFGKDVLAEEVTKFLDEKLNDYFNENNIEYIGDLLKSETEETKFDFEKDKDFQFAFDFGYYPEIEINIENLTIPYYKIKVTDEELEKEISNLQKQHGTFVEVEKAQEDSTIYADIIELNDDETPKEKGINIQDGLISLKFVSEEARKKFIEAKKDDKLILNIKEAFSNETDLAGLLKIKKEELDNINNKFEFTIKKIEAFKDAEINEDLFKKVFPEDEIKSEEEFKQKVKEAIEKQFENESKIRVRYDIKNVLMDTVKMPLPEEFIIKWQKSKRNVDENKIREELPILVDTIKWDKIIQILGKKYKLEIDTDDLIESSKANIVNYLAQIGYPTSMFSDEQLQEFAERELDNMDENARLSLIFETMERKVLDGISDKFNKEEKEITINELSEIYKKEKEELEQKYKPQEEAKEEQKSEENKQTAEVSETEENKNQE